MSRILLALAAIVTLGTDTAVIAAPPANSYSERLKGLGELQRFAALRAAIVSSDERCRRVERADYRGPLRNLIMWSVRCSDGGDYGLFIGPDGSVQVRTCSDLAKLRLPLCLLPPRAAAPKQAERRH